MAATDVSFDHRKEWAHRPVSGIAVRPNFLVIGSQKAGTSHLYRVLMSHPEVFVSPRKEVDFFFREDYFRQGLKWYEAHFAHWSGEPLIGEVSPSYLVTQAAPERIRKTLGRVKLIALVREPASRAYSQYWHNRRTFSEHRSFDELARGELDPVWQRGKPGYFSRGTYVIYLERYLETFAREDLLVLVYEDLKRDPGAVYRRVFEFLGVRVDFTSEVMAARHNAASVPDHALYRWLFERPALSRRLPLKVRLELYYRGRRRPFEYPPMSAETRARLDAFYAPYNARLRACIEHALPGWS